MFNIGMLRWLWLSSLVLLLDQFTKLGIAHTMSLYQSTPLLSFFSLTYVHNNGAAFSFLSDGDGWQRWLFVALAVGMSAVMGVWLARLKEDETRLAQALSLVLGGALGNLIDRLLYGYVIDFLDFYWDNWHWPAFNIADSAITIGVGLMLIDSFKAKTPQGHHS